MKTKIKIILFYFLLLIVTLSCSKKWCYEKYPMPENDSISKIETATIDTLYIPIPSDTTFLQVAADCPDQKIIYKDGKIEYKVVIKDKVLTISKINQADSLRFIYSYKNTDEFRKLTQIKEVPLIEYKAPKWSYYLIGVVIVLIGWITRKIWLKFIKFPI